MNFSLQYGNQRLGISPPKPAEVGMGSALFLEISSDTFQELVQYFSELSLKVLSVDRGYVICVNYSQLPAICWELPFLNAYCNSRYLRTLLIILGL